MCDSSQETRDVFKFSDDQTDFSMTDVFKSDLSSANSPLLVVLIGNGRAGKSTRANQLVKHELEPDGPFVADAGMDPITMGFQYVGPFKFGTLAEIHGIELNVDGDPDIFLIDCEGLHSLGEATPALKKATFALSQLASITLLVMSEPVNHQNIEHVRALLLLSHAFSRDLPGFANGTTIMMREIGVPTERGRKQSLKELNQKRENSDCEHRTKIIGLLEEAKVHCTTETLLVLAQPQLYRQTELYWKSIEDFLKFTAAIASLRANITGSSLIDLFMESKPLIMQIEDFANPSLPFEQVLKKVANGYLEASHKHVIDILDREIGEQIDQINSVELRKGLHVDFITKKIEFAMHEFEQTAERSLPHLRDYFPAQTQAFEKRVEDDVETICNQRFLERCLAIVVPELQEEIVGQAKADIQVEMTKLPLPEVGLFSFSKLSSQYETRVASCFGEAISKIHSGIATFPGFHSLIHELRTRISDYVLEVEIVRKHEHFEYVKAESERIRKEQDAKFLEEMARVGQEEAEKQRKKDEEMFETLRKETEEKTRQQIELAQNLATMKAQCESQERMNKALKEMEGKAQKDKEEMVKDLQRQQQERDVEFDRKRKDDAAHQERKERELQNTIEQLKKQVSTAADAASATATDAAVREAKEKRELQDKVHNLELKRLQDKLDQSARDRVTAEKVAAREARQKEVHDKQIRDLENQRFQDQIEQLARDKATAETARKAEEEAKKKGFFRRIFS